MFIAVLRSLIVLFSHARSQKFSASVRSCSCACTATSGGGVVRFDAEHKVRKCNARTGSPRQLAPCGLTRASAPAAATTSELPRWVGGGTTLRSSDDGTTRGTSPTPLARSRPCVRSLTDVEVLGDAHRIASRCRCRTRSSSIRRSGRARLHGVAHRGEFLGERSRPSIGAKWPATRRLARTQATVLIASM
jgi:hypothetical protein